MKKAIITLNIGDESNHLKTVEISKPRMMSYAEKCGADFIEINEIKIGKKTYSNEKFQLYDIIQDYDIIFFLDSDCVISYDATDIFELLGYKTCLPSFDVDMFNDNRKDSILEELLLVEKEFNEKKLKDFLKTFIMTGCLYVTKDDYKLFKKPSENLSLESIYNEEPLITYNVYKYKIKYENLPKEFSDLSGKLYSTDRYIYHPIGKFNYIPHKKYGRALVRKWKAMQYIVEELEKENR